MKEKISPDLQKAQALKKMALLSYERVNELSFDKYPSNTLVDLYDIIHKLADAHCLVQGIKFRGEGAHFELFTELNILDYINERELQFLQQVRTLRNRIQYEGFFIQTDYITRNRKKIETIIKRLSTSF